MYKGVYFTNDLNSSFPCEVVSLLQEFIDIFSEEISYGLLPLRGTENQIDFIPGALLPNSLAYRSSPEEEKEIQSKLMSSCKRDL